MSHFYGPQQPVEAAEARAPSPDELVEWLHQIDSGKPKRTPGLLLEIAFSKVILPKVAGLIGVTELSFGWCFVRRRLDGREVRLWFRIGSRRKLNRAEQELIAILAEQGHQFFLIGSAIRRETCANGRYAFPQIDLTVYASKFAKRLMSVQAYGRAERLAADLQRSISALINGKLREMGTSGEEKVPFARWFGKLSTSELGDLLTARAVLNFGLEYPIDVDAIAMRRDGRPTVLEFKRKAPAQGRYTRSGLSCGSEMILLGQKLSLVFSHRTRLDENMRTAGFQRLPAPCYGLDLSHYGTVCMCGSNDLGYQYIVWDRSLEMGQKAGFGTPDDLGSVIGEDFVPVKWPQLYSADISERTISGFSFTGGMDSGAFTSKVRVQLTFDKNAFLLLEEPA